MVNNQIPVNCSSLISSQSCSESPLPHSGPPLIYDKDYSNDVSTLFEMDNDHHRGTKRHYAQDFPSYPPPPYIDPRIDQVSPPNKKMRVDPQTYHPNFEHNFQPYDCFQFANIDSQKRFCHEAMTEGDVFHQPSYKNYSDDSGTGRSVISPTPINPPEDHYSIYSLQTPLHTSSVDPDKQLTSAPSTHIYPATIATNSAFGNRQFCSQLPDFEPNISSENTSKFNNFPLQSEKVNNTN